MNIQKRIMSTMYSRAHIPVQEEFGHRIENKTEGRLSIDHSKELYICWSCLFVYIRLPYTYTVAILNIPHKININPTQSSQFIQDVEKNNIHAIDIVFCHNLLRIFVLI